MGRCVPFSRRGNSLVVPNIDISELINRLTQVLYLTRKSIVLGALILLCECQVFRATFMRFWVYCNTIYEYNYKSIQFKKGAFLNPATCISLTDNNHRGQAENCKIYNWLIQEQVGGNSKKTKSTIKETNIKIIDCLFLSHN